LKGLWIVTLANIAAMGLLLLIIYAILQVIGIGAYTITWPLFVLLPICLTLSFVGLWFARRAKSAVARRVGYGLNGFMLAIPAIVTLYIGGLFLSATREKYVIPAAYKGEIYIVHSVANGERSEKSFWGVTYRIPNNGVLFTQIPEDQGPTRAKYYYQLNDGTLQRIRYEWYSTIQRTPENLANDRDIGIFFPRSGHFSDSLGCDVEFDEFYVGTKSDILQNYKKGNLDTYVRDHPAVCAAPTK